MTEKENVEMREDSVSVAKKKGRRHGLFSLVVCLLIAFVVWLYASSLEKKNQEEQHTNQAYLPSVTETVSFAAEL